MPTDKKRAEVAELKEELANATIAVGTSYQGLTVAAITDIRQKLREKGVAYKVVKNTLLGVAAKELAQPLLPRIVEGPTAVAYSGGDPVEVAKAVDELIRVQRIPITVRGAVMGKDFLTSEQVAQLASIPPRPILLSQLLGQMQAPIARFMAVLNGPAQALAILLQRRVEQMQEQGGQAA